MIGVAASAASREAILVAGVAGVVAGAMSMAVGEYVSVSSQRDAEQADVQRETEELKRQPKAELHELARIYMARGLDHGLAMKVAEQLSAHDRLGAHLPRTEPSASSAAFLARFNAEPRVDISAASFTIFGLFPILALLVAPAGVRIPAIAVLSLLSLAALGAFGGHLGGAPIGRAALRVTIGGGLAMAVTAAIGHIFGVATG